ncbi:MAG TPA: hypothetical protein VFQ76_21335, partial [Longimicrobiaceae bacterium]|nr:hypothetical protein [Longimicrobiaceae bacterium]
RVRITTVAFSGDATTERSEGDESSAATPVWVFRSAFLVISAKPRKSGVGHAPAGYESATPST